MDETVLLEYIPIIGDIYKYGKLGYKIGSYLSNDSATDELLSRMIDSIQAASNSDNITEAYSYLNNFRKLIDEYQGGLKYQNALFIYLCAKGSHLLALCKWTEYSSNLEELRKIEEIFKYAKKTCLSISKIEMTWLTSNREIIKDVRKLVAEEKSNISESKKKWKKHCRKLYRLLYPRKFWIIRISKIIFMIAIGLILVLLILSAVFFENIDHYLKYHY